MTIEKSMTDEHENFPNFKKNLSKRLFDPNKLKIAPQNGGAEHIIFSIFCLYHELEAKMYQYINSTKTGIGWPPVMNGMNETREKKVY